MFTGIITDVGVVESLARSEHESRLAISCAYPDIIAGESVSVNGVCLTAIRDGRGALEAVAAAETLARTTLGSLAIGARVNLERALQVGSRLGGHLVAGHVDGVGVVDRDERIGDARRWTIAAPPDVLRFVATKGSITVDGVSLTVNAVDPRSFAAMLVPFTLAATTLGGLVRGARVNLEVDLIARYVARLIEPQAADAPVDLALLERAGFVKKS